MNLNNEKVSSHVNQNKYSLFLEENSFKNSPLSCTFFKYKNN